MKKRAALPAIILIILLSLNLIPLAFAQDDSADILEVNPQTGQIKSFEEFQKVASTLSKEEKAKEYLKQEWTKLLAENKFLSPILFYTDKAFSFFNPIWKIIFGIEFSWSWIFFFSIIFWIILIIVLYAPAKAFTDFNPVLTLIFSIILASLAGPLGLFQKANSFLTPIIGNFIAVILAIITGIIFVSAYQIIIWTTGKKLKSETEEEKQKRAKEKIRVAGDLAEEELEE